MGTVSGMPRLVSYIHCSYLMHLRLGHSNWNVSFPLLDVTTSMQAGGLLLLSYYSPDI